MEAELCAGVALTPTSARPASCGCFPVTTQEADLKVCRNFQLFRRALVHTSTCDVRQHAASRIMQHATPHARLRNTEDAVTSTRANLLENVKTNCTTKERPPSLTPINGWTHTPAKFRASNSSHLFFRGCSFLSCLFPFFVETCVKTFNSRIYIQILQPFLLTSVLLPPSLKPKTGRILQQLELHYNIHTAVEVVGQIL